MSVRVTVVIPTYNRAGYICDAIDSVLSQTYKDYEIIVVDDGSTDDTKGILSKYNGKIRYFYQENKGVAAARNRGIKKAKGEYIAFLDSDDIWLPEKLQLQLETLNNHRDYSWAYCDRKYVYEGDFKERTHRKYPAYHGNIFDFLFMDIFVKTTTVIVKKECFNCVGYFKEELRRSEDYDLFLRLAKKYRIVYIDRQLILYRVHKHSLCRESQELSYTTHLKILKNCVRTNYSYFRQKRKLVKLRFGDLHYKLARFYFFQSDSKIKVICELLKSMRYSNKIIKSILAIIGVSFSDIQIVRNKMREKWEWNY